MGALLPFRPRSLVEAVRSLRHGGIIGRKQCAPRLFVYLLLERVILSDRTGARRRGAGLDRGEQALKIGKGGKGAHIAGQHSEALSNQPHTDMSTIENSFPKIKACPAKCSSKTR